MTENISKKRRRIILDIWVYDRQIVEDYADKLELSLRELLPKGVTEYKIHVDLFASERPLIGDHDYPLNIKSLEKVKGRFRCDFCHEESHDLVKIRFPGIIFTPCPKCLKKIQKAIQAWYNWCQEKLVEKSMVEMMKE